MPLRYSLFSMRMLRKNTSFITGKNGKPYCMDHSIGLQGSLAQKLLGGILEKQVRQWTILFTCECERDVLLVSVYDLPTGSTYYVNLNCNNGINTLEECILHLCTQQTDCFLIVFSDLNIRTGN